ncbi:hypothetical protein P7C70_g7012, partial [Phenoliferia sp. Uapishka_3]
MRLAPFIAATSVISYASAHAVITAVVGTNGVVTTGFGVVSGTLRTGTDEQPFQTDTSVLKDLTTDPCGATLRGGAVNIAENLASVTKQGSGQLPSLSANLSITMDLHQINADGGGPFSAVVNTDATGRTWVAANVTQQAPGANAVIQQGPNNAQLTVQLPSGTACTGGAANNACLVRISNGGPLSVSNGAGPFGGCLAVQSPDSAAASNSSTVAARSMNSRDSTILDLALASVLSERDNSLMQREARLSLKRNLNALARRGVFKRSLALTPGDLEDIKTATGTAIDIVIDHLAGHDDTAATGGNSSEGAAAAKNALLTFQQSTDTKEAVKTAIAAALAILTNPATAISNNTFNPDDTAAANALARQQIDSGITTTVNAGNAGVGFVNFATVSSLIGALTEINTSEAVAGSTIALTISPAAATQTAAANSTVATTPAVKKGKGKKAKAKAGTLGATAVAKLHKRRLPSQIGSGLV